MRKLYLTKKRKEALRLERSIDDIMNRYLEKHEQRIQEYARHLQRTYKNVIQVKRRDIKNGIDIIEPIIAVQKVDGEGIIVVIRG